MKNTYPSSSSCEGCPQWDDINGCWNGKTDVTECNYIGEDCSFDGDAYDEGIEP